ncbi:ankyrin repeat protein [Colletotrichum chrysophilum]|uniref:Ankyrin repeat protein n=1 Tax=Colletotrichum chrysophilum TaxID=1836956 RepID=A0AAD9AV49_9PEZI|nr:ankyrin repeat protein [Colletotrichum chrysophilum]
MLDQYLADGGSILSESISPIYIAVDEANTGGLSILLNHIRANEKEYGERAGVARLTVGQMSVDMPCNGFPPLHMAIERANRTAIRLLLDNGADVEATDSFNRTPLIYATQRLVGMDAFFIVNMLVRAGSNLNHRDSKGMGPLIGACKSRSSPLIIYLVRIGANLHTTDHVGSNCLHHLLDNCDETKTASIVPSTFLRLTGMLIDPYQANKSGWSAVHISMHRTSMTALLLNGDFQLTDLAPMSRSTLPKCHACPEAACLPSGFRLYCRKMSFERFRKLLNTEPADAWSPLCRAAAIGNTEVMKNLLSIGSLIDFEGCTEGSALMTASRAGILKSVKFLTRHGASISFQGRKQHYSAVEASARSPKVRRWLLVDRFTDQLKLKWAQEVSDVSTENLKKWSGIMKAEMVILGPWERRASESSRQYWSRLEQMKKGFNGKVVPPDQGAKTRRQSKLIPSEPVNIAAGGYNSTGENRQTLGF